MSTGISINDIKNDYIRSIVQEVDASGVGTKDQIIDENELSVFIEKLQKQKNKCSSEDFAQVLGLFKSQLESNKQSNTGEIIKNSIKNALKEPFYEENSFSLKKTLQSVGTMTLYMLGGVGIISILSRGKAIGLVSRLKLSKTNIEQHNNIVNIDKTKSVTQGGITRRKNIKQSAIGSKQFTGKKEILKETTFENNLRKEVCTDGKNLTTKWYDSNGKIVKAEYSVPDKDGVIKVERTKGDFKKTYADGHTWECTYNKNTGWYDYRMTYPDGRVEIQENAFRLTGV